MSFKSFVFAASSVAALTLAGAAMAGGMMVHDAYARVSTKMSASGAAFMQIMNHTGADDRLINARSDVAERVELHTHLSDANGVMKMVHVEEGFAIPAGETHMLMRGGDHVMFLGLKETLHHGDMVPLTLVFEKAGEVSVDVPVDLERKPGHGGMMHGKHSN
ncbi:copper chaperone PCu(A)C [Phycobacter sp. K97]|uniref:copper chaperone PCu(A)C n=1 Tax=Phycobacter sedimenti TaxID=3133977 RepID=UPI00311F3C2A